MWKQGSCEQELFEGMQKAEEHTAEAEENQEQKLIVEAMEALNAAAESFERAGRKERAKEVTVVMMSLAKKDKEKDKDKASSKKKSSKDEVKKVFKFFGFGPEDLEGLDSSDGGGDGE
jgi:uncharacterized FAD-dependent dehydrogenase